MSQQWLKVLSPVHAQAKVLELKRKDGLDVLRINRHQGVSEKRRLNTQRAHCTAMLLVFASKVFSSVDGESLLAARIHAQDDIGNTCRVITRHPHGGLASQFPGSGSVSEALEDQVQDVDKSQRRGRNARCQRQLHGDSVSDVACGLEEC